MTMRDTRTELREIGHELAVIALCLLPLLRGILRPYWISIPTIGGVVQWRLIFIGALLFPTVATVILLLIGDSYRTRHRLMAVDIARGIGGIFLLYLGSVLYYGIRLYVLWNSTPLTRNFLWPRSNYYSLKIWEFTLPYLLYIGAGVIGAVLFFILYWVTRGRVVEKSEAILGFFLGLIHGPERIVFVLFIAFGLTVVWFLLKKFRGNPAPALRVTPGLFIASYLVLLFVW